MRQLSVIFLTMLALIIPTRPPSPSSAESPQAAQAYYVAKNGNDNNSGTEALPFRTIQRGINALGSGDTVFVKTGTYTEGLRDIPSGESWSSPTTVAAYPGDTVVVNGDWSGYTVYIVAHYVVLDRFTLDGSNASKETLLVGTAAHHVRIQDSEIKNSVASGIFVKADYIELVNLAVHHNGTHDKGHGVYIRASHNLIEGCTVYHNAGWGIHIYDNFTGGTTDENTVRNNIVYENGRDYGGRGVGIGLYTGTGNSAINNLVWGNYIGVAVNYDAVNTRVHNNTVYANHTAGIRIGGGGGDFGPSVGASVRNNIAYLNDNPQIGDDGVGTTMDHNLVGVKPYFVSRATRDFHLTSSSPAIDVGATLSDVPTDIAGVSRPRGTAYDIGAYESPYSTGITDLRITNATGSPPTVTVTLRWTAPIGAITYTLRSSDALITSNNWDSAQDVPVPFTASDPGTVEWLTVSVAYTDGTLYLALKSHKSDGTWSGISNNAFWPHKDIYLPLAARGYAP